MVQVIYHSSRMNKLLPINLHKGKKKMNNRDFMQDADAVMAQIRRGAFLTVQCGKNVNTMTIGWATIGIIWQLPVFMVAVRDSRYTFELIEKASSFSVTVPFADNFKKEVLFCGTKSGRDYNKFKECRLELKSGQQIESPVIDIPGIHYECRIVYKSAMDSTFLDTSLEKLYPAKDYHTLYFGEIAACYET